MRQLAFVGGRLLALGLERLLHGRQLGVAIDGLVDELLDKLRGRVGCINSLSGCRGFVFVDQAAEQVSSSRRYR